jgi:hypothetical protein
MRKRIYPIAVSGSIDVEERIAFATLDMLLSVIIKFNQLTSTDTIIAARMAILAMSRELSSLNASEVVKMGHRKPDASQRSHT